MEAGKDRAKVLTKRQKKQKFREQRYKKALGSKKEGHGFAEFKKQKAVHEYNKLLRKEEAKQKYKTLHRPSPPAISSPKTESGNTSNEQPKKPRKLNTIQKTQKRLKEQAIEKEEAKREKAATEAAKSKALARYQTKKQEKYRLMCKKNFRGQPKVAGQMALLLKKIEASRKT